MIKLFYAISQLTSHWILFSADTNSMSTCFVR